MIELVQVIANLATTVALGIASWQLYVNSKQRRAEHIFSLLSLFHSDTAMYDIYYKIEYGNFKYDESHHLSKEEKDLDRLLGFFDNIGRLYFMGLINKSDFGIFGYEMKTMLDDDGVVAYLSFITDYSKSRHRPNPFPNLEKLRNLFPK
ncbi:hypothetical protein EHQ52_15300 [Leptospira koniambonensis]|uniref:DUF4760 domain-containing protein n=1 Tax=Leptospira koniambonensis TaxID=2484950 RepID=A0A4R9J3X1_9LEPT|nr:hypothetical protein [Leptospira koniambonensis]TGL31304.1 hypothetical protein EHQ52_15300 [Leptospira koniambonensis]